MGTYIVIVEVKQSGGKKKRLPYKLTATNFQEAEKQLEILIDFLCEVDNEGELIFLENEIHLIG